MAIHKIDDIRINGKNKAFGGYIYAVDCNVGLVNQPTTFKVSFVNESGTYVEPDLSLSSPYKIRVGNILEDNYYAVSYEKVRGSTGRILNVTFIDGSHILDRLFVALNRRMASPDDNIPGIIVVGREMHPCDLNDNGGFDADDAANLKYVQNDPCELRCPQSENTLEPIIESCIEKELNELFDVKYSFSELMNAIQGIASPAGDQRIITFPNGDEADISVTLPPVQATKNSNKSNRVKIKNLPSVINNKYLTNYHGTLREVLQNWCADFGWSFYWENDSLNFIDTKARPNIRLQAFANMESYSETKTLEGTVARGVITHYGEHGITAQQDCNNVRPVLLHCLTLRDLFGEFYKPSWRAVAVTQGDMAMPSTPATVLDPPIPSPSDSDSDGQTEYVDDIAPNGVAIDNFEKSVVCSYFDEKLRHLYNFWQYYGIHADTDALALVGKNLDRLGQMQIARVMSNTSVNPLDKTMYSNLVNNDIATVPDKIMTPEVRADFEKYKGYFILARVNSELLDKQFRIEQRLANDFIGRHWYRAYVAPFYGETPQITPGGAQYYGALSTSIKDVPFAQYSHTYKSPIGQMVSSFDQKQQINYKYYGRLGISKAVAKNTATKLVRSIIYMSKNPVWQPIKDSRSGIKDLMTSIEPGMFRILDIPLSTKKLLASGTGVKPEDVSGLTLLMVFPGSLAISSSFEDNKLDENPFHGEALEVYALSSYGLLNKKCVKYDIAGVPIYTPTGSSVLFAGQSTFKWLYREPENKEYSTPTYKVYVSLGSKNRGSIPKLESVQITPPPSTGNGLSDAMKVDYKVREINRGSVAYLNQLDPTSCRIPAAILKKAHDDFSKDLNFSVTKPFQTYQYRLFGVQLPSRLSIRDGLESITVRVDEKGVNTTINIGNSLFTPPAPEFLTRLLELGINPSIYNNRKNQL